MKKRKTVADWALENMPAAVPGDISAERLREVREALRNWRRASLANRIVNTAETLDALRDSEAKLEKVAEKEANNGE
jgi:hypothetical protein